MPKNKFHSSVKFIEVEYLKNNRFSFIKNEILKENIAINMQYIVFLLSLEEEYELPGAVTYSSFKTIIVLTASIVESLIHYKLDELIKSNKIKEEDVTEKEKKYTDCKILHKISDTEQICGIKKTTKAKRLSHDTNFVDLNNTAKRSGLFTDDLFRKSDKIRIARNRLHPYGLKEVDNKYSKKDINNIFSMAEAIIKRIQTY
jgi:hypothetical protein